MTMRGSIRRWTEVSTREVLQIQERSYSLVWIIGCCSNNCINEKSQREPPMHTMNSILIHPLFKYKQPNPFVLHNRKMLRKDHRHYPWETLKGKGQTTSNLSAIVSQENVSQRVYEQNVPLLRQFLHQTSSIFCIKSFFLKCLTISDIQILAHLDSDLWRPKQKKNAVRVTELQRCWRKVLAIKTLHHSFTTRSLVISPNCVTLRKHLHHPKNSVANSSRRKVDILWQGKD